MKSLLRFRVWSAVVALFFTAAGAAQAGTFYTGLATVKADSKDNPPVVVGIEDVQVIMFQGKDSLSYTNTYGTDPVTGAPLVRVVAVTQLQLYDTLTGTYAPINYGDNQVVTGVTVLDGFVESTTADTGTVFFTSGRVGLFTVETQNDFDPGDPSSWGAVVVDGNGDPSALATPITTFVLKPPETVRDGLQAGFPILSDVDGVPFTETTVNRSTVDFSPSGNAIGNLLFKEDPANIGLEGNQFIEVTSPVFPPAIVDAEGYFVQYRQSINSAKTGDVSEDNLEFLNFIAHVLGGYADLGGNAALGRAFATGLIVDPANGADFDTTYDGGAADADHANRFFGDFVAGYDAIPSNQGELRGVRPGVETIDVVPIPEPSTLVLAGLGGLTFLGKYSRRRKAARKKS